MSDERILCKCHQELVRTIVIKGKPFNRKIYRCDVTGFKLFEFQYERVRKKVNLPDPDDTRDGSEVECPEDLERALVDYKKRQAGDD